MIDQIISWLARHHQVDLLASGATLGVAGSVIATVHRVVPRFFGLLRRVMTVCVTIDGRSDLFEPVLLWLNDHPYAVRCRRLREVDPSVRTVLWA